MPLCPRCHKRPAKRSCPALRTTICAICCASDRMIELACPDSCSYLRAARAESRDREVEQRSKEARAGGSLDLGMNQRSMAVAYLTDQTIVNAHRGIGGSRIERLTDQEALAAIENAVKNLETEESGLIYEHRDTSPRISELSGRLRRKIAEAFENELVEARPRRSELIRALNYIRDAIRAHAAREGAQADSYIRYVSLFCPWPEESTTSLIV